MKVSHINFIMYVIGLHFLTLVYKLICCKFCDGGKSRKYYNVL